MKLSDLARRLVIAISAVTVVCIAVSAIYYRSWAFLPFLFGALLGGAVSVGKVVLLERAVDRALAMEKNRAGNYISLQHLLRLGLSAAALLLGALVPQISLWGVAAGILAYQVSLYIVKKIPESRGGSQ